MREELTAWIRTVTSPAVYATLILTFVGQMHAPQRGDVPKNYIVGRFGRAGGPSGA